MQLQALKKVAPLVANHVCPWRPDPDRPDVIIGEYAEDGSRYTVIVPTKLREAILAMHDETLQQANVLRRSLLRAEQAQKGARTCEP